MLVRVGVRVIVGVIVRVYVIGLMFMGMRVIVIMPVGVTVSVPMIVNRVVFGRSNRHPINGHVAGEPASAILAHSGYLQTGQL